MSSEFFGRSSYISRIQNLCAELNVYCTVNKIDADLSVDNKIGVYTDFFAIKPDKIEWYSGERPFSDNVMNTINGIQKYLALIQEEYDDIRKEFATSIKKNLEDCRNLNLYDKMLEDGTMNIDISIDENYRSNNIVPITYAYSEDNFLLERICVGIIIIPTIDCAVKKSEIIHFVEDCFEKDKSIIKIKCGGGDDLKLAKILKEKFPQCVYISMLSYTSDIFLRDFH